uniref:CD40 antigen n=2 Tax=Iconisemion striatum TaxID=60296 RepID=A0A1A7XCY3_9TELE
MFIYLLVCVSASLVLSSAQASDNQLCDPETQYRRDGQCCTMCPLGTRMQSSSSCLDPVCDPCGINEYQDKYTTNNKCNRQPYCDPNTNFESPAEQSKKAKTICMCKEGFHCSGKECITCAKHSTCQPGYEVVSKGSKIHDTICRQCPNGTFVSSTSGKCEKWTECEPGFYAAEGGTSESDTQCVSRHRTHIIVGVITAGAVTLMMIGVCWCWCGNSRKGHQDINGHTIVDCTHADECEEGHKISTPVENEHTDVSSDDLGITDQGNYVAQEFGKLERLSRQESHDYSRPVYLISP